MSLLNHLLDAHAAKLGDVSRYFVDHDGPGLRVVEHATGRVAFALDASGALVPYVTPAPSGQDVTAGFAPGSLGAAFGGGARA